MKGALCRDSEHVIVAYYDAPDQIQEAMWYTLSDIKPGWKVVYGTQGEPGTWRFMVETTNGVPAEYINLNIGSGCAVPDAWLSDTQ